VADANTTTATQGVPSTSTGTGTGGPPQGGQPQDGAFTGMMFPLAAMAILFWLFIIRPESKRRKEKDALASALKKSDKVVTIFGMYGTIVDMDGDDITLLIDPKKDVKMKVRRSAIDQVLTAEEAKK
jgi:preprotein translocase subunit YajC